MKPAMINSATSALRDLAGLIPAEDRKYSEDHIKTLETFIAASSAIMGLMREIEIISGRANSEIASAVAKMGES